VAGDEPCRARCVLLRRVKPRFFGGQARADSAFLLKSAVGQAGKLVDANQPGHDTKPKSAGAMKLKFLPLAALLAATITTTLAQSSNVFSVNAVGYVNLSLAPGFSMISNPLNASNNVVGTLFPDAPNGFVIFKFNPAANNYDLNFRSSGAWSAPNMTLNPGEGIFIFNNQSSNVVVTYVGEVPQGSLTNSLPTGFTIRSSQVPQAGALESVLQFPGVSGDLVFIYNRVNNNYDIFVRGASAWSPSDPNISVAQSFFLFRNVAGNWVRNFSVNQ
jgi:hypothetical protein